MLFCQQINQPTNGQRWKLNLLGGNKDIGVFYNNCFGFSGSLQVRFEFSKDKEFNKTYYPFWDCESQKVNRCLGLKLSFSIPHISTVIFHVYTWIPHRPISCKHFSLKMWSYMLVTIRLNPVSTSFSAITSMIAALVKELRKYLKVRALTWDWGKTPNHRYFLTQDLQMLSIWRVL